jgi:hypothetical protein
MGDHGSAAYKVELIMVSDAVLTLVGQIIHVDHEYSDIYSLNRMILALFNAGPLQVNKAHSRHATLSSTFIRLLSMKSIIL